MYNKIKMLWLKKAQNIVFSRKTIMIMIIFKTTKRKSLANLFILIL